MMASDALRDPLNVTAEELRDALKDLVELSGKFADAYGPPALKTEIALSIARAKTALAKSEIYL